VIKPINSINGIPLLLSGYRGKGVTIAVLDAGFLDADKIESLYALKARQGITRTYDYITGSNNVFGYSSHGTGVLSILAGNLPGVITGTAQDADYMLFRTEDSFSEYPVEEDFWVAAAEYADSAGADIITSSLGYYIFDNPEMDYAFSEADGNTAFITIAADRAASKGILVVCSAGNERDTEWQRICFPSDGDSVLCIGAVTAGGIISEFSSAGYSADERVKPDVVAQGVRVPLQYTSGSWLYGDGTSFSCPVISGMCASLMQAVPGATATEIADAVRRSADRYNNPDSLYGYGMPDFTKALEILYTEYAYKPEVKITAGPNPFTEEINIWFRESPESLSIIIADNSGKTVYRKDLITFIGRSYSVTGLSGLSPGIYVMKIKTSTEEAHFKLVKL